MGQYYQPMILDDDGRPMKSFNSHYYNNGLKLMEHSYLDNEFVAAVESYLAMDAALPVIWCGDYADEDLWALVTEDMEVRFAGYEPPSYFSGERTPNAVRPMAVTTESHPYIVNVTLKEYVDKREVPAEDPDYPDFRIHPLPLLTVNSNGRGGGDYRGDWPHVGRWSDKSRIAVTANPPADDGYTKLDVTGLV